MKPHVPVHSADFRIEAVHHLSIHALTAALDLLNRTQGDGLFDEVYLQRKLSSDDARVLVAWHQDEIISVGCAELLFDFSYYTPFDPTISRRLQPGKTGSLCTLSVAEPWQGKGIGQQMSRARMQWLLSKGCEAILGVSWVSKLPHTSDRVFEKTGFRQVARVSQFYHEQAQKHPFDCPGCQHQPCICDAILYEWHATDAGTHRFG